MHVTHTSCWFSLLGSNMLGHICKVRSQHIMHVSYIVSLTLSYSSCDWGRGESLGGGLSLQCDAQ